MKVHIGVDKDSGLIQSIVTTATNVHDHTPAAELLDGEEIVVYGVAGYQGIAQRPEMAGHSVTFRVAMRPGKRRALSGQRRWKAAGSDRGGGGTHPRQGRENPFRVIKQQFDVLKTRRQLLTTV